MTNEEFVKSRMNGIGGSDVGSILQFPDAFQTPFQVWYSKLNYVESPDNEKMKAGRYLEPVICKMFEDETGYKVQRNLPAYKHPDHPFLMGNIDGLISPKEGDDGAGVLEIKNVDWLQMRYWIGEVKPSYYAQFQHYLYVTGLKWGYFAILVSGWDLKTYRFKRDDEYLGTVIPKLIHFWEYNVLGGNQPEITDLGDAKLAYQNAIKDSLIEADDAALAAHANFNELKSQIKELEQKKDACELLLKNTMKEKEVLVYEDRPLVRWKPDKNGRRIFKAVN